MQQEGTGGSLATTTTMAPEPVWNAGLGKRPFPMALFMEHLQSEIHLCELAMRSVSYTIRQKDEWWLKMKDDKIREKWMQEAVAARPANGIRLAEEHMVYVLDELQRFADARDPDTGIQVSLQTGFWESDKLIPAKLKEALQNELEKLRNVPDELKDWHPGSDQQVLDLVHPSMYCIRYGSTMICDGVAQNPPLPAAQGFFCVKDLFYVPSGSAGAAPAVQGARCGLSMKTAWLPTDFVYSEESKSVTAASYINSVHPVKQAKLGAVLKEILACFVPVFERVLGDLKGDHTARVLAGRQSTLDESRRPINPATGEGFRSWDETDTDGENVGPDWKAWMATYPWKDPKPPSYQAPDKPLGSGVSLDKQALQVIIKVAEIHLTPDKPEYPGGSWHIEGMLNERIVATGIYYVSCENISTSNLSFRTALDREGPQDYEQDDPDGILLHSYGLEKGSQLNQYLGHIEAKTDRCVAFPNLYQHRVEPFRLLDSTKPGRRTIVAFFLCDPTNRVLSTTDVPPQQVEWMSEMLFSQSVTKSSLLDLPAEIKERILLELQHDGVLLDRKQAEAVREELMTERSAAGRRLNRDLFEVGYSLCEH